MRKPDLIVTPTARLAREEARRIATENTANGRAAWVRLDVLSFAAWLSELRDAYFLTAADDRVPIGASQAQVLWQSIIDKDVFIGEPRVAEMAQQAWRLIHEHQLQAPALWPALLLSEDNRRFKDWVARYRTLCTRRGLVDEWAFAAEVPQLLADGRIVVRQAIELVGFDLPITPLQRSILAALKDAGTQITQRVQPTRVPVHPEILAFVEPDDELLAAARWARARLEVELAQSIAIVVPDLAGRVARVESLLRQVFDPPAFGLERAGPEPWHISLGKPLARWPLVTDALAVLALAESALNQPQAGRLLRSPFLHGWNEEAGIRANAVALLARNAPYQLTTNELQYALNEVGAHNLAGQLSSWQILRHEFRTPATPSVWAARFQQELSSLGFGNGRALDSREYQVLQRWHDLLEEFSALDVVTDEPIVRPHALALVAERAQSIIFREHNPGVPVEILGVEEALGSSFDALWITTLDNETWPKSAQRDPLIPGPVQAEVPSATSTGRLEQARRELNGLLAAATETRGSFARGRGDEDIEVTPILAGCVVHDVESTVAPTRAAMAEPIEEFQAPSLQPSRVRGGTGLLQNQSDCPFRAFSERRLNARDLSLPRPGLDARSRGNLIHRALEEFWQGLPDQAALKALSDDALDARVHTAVESALHQLTERYRLTLSSAGRALEQTSTQRIVRRWLDDEKQREPFSVAALERPISMRFAGLELTGKIDRVDRLPSGETLLIDYKTGSTTKGDWFPEPRIADPQLPAYAVAMQPHPAAITFARIRPDDLGFEGLAGINTGIAGVTEITAAKGRFKELESWPQLLADWQLHLEALASDFAAGNAQVDPRKPAVCNFCHLHALCRIHERAPLSELVSGETVDE